MSSRAGYTELVGVDCGSRTKIMNDVGVKISESLDKAIMQDELKKIEIPKQGETYPGDEWRGFVVFKVDQCMSEIARKNAVERLERNTPPGFTLVVVPQGCDIEIVAAHAPAKTISKNWYEVRT